MGSGRGGEGLWCGKGFGEGGERGFQCKGFGEKGDGLTEDAGKQQSHGTRLLRKYRGSYSTAPRTDAATDGSPSSHSSSSFPSSTSQPLLHSPYQHSQL